MTFDQFNLSPALQKRLQEASFVTPTPIQEKAIPPLLEGRDLVGIAQTGTGKTLAFSLPLVEKLSSGRSRSRMPRAIILSPTRELAAQNMRTLDVLLKGTAMKAVLIIGGESPVEQRKILNGGVDIIVATPGRLMDQFDQGAILLVQTHHIIIDEADRMLDMGFIPDIEKILKLIRSPQRQTVMFSATMPPAIEKLTQQFLKNPIQVMVSPESSVTTTVSQNFILTTPRHRMNSFGNILAQETITQGIVFSNRKRDMDTIASFVQRKGLTVGVLNGDIVQSKRTEVLAAFRAGEITFLVASDVAARGLDIKGVSHVFNMEIPMSPEDYVHRIGRTGRAGAAGNAFTFLLSADQKKFAPLEQMIKDAALLIDDRPESERGTAFPFPIRLKARAVLSQQAPEMSGPKSEQKAGQRKRQQKPPHSVKQKTEQGNRSEKVLTTPVLLDAPLSENKPSQSQVSQQQTKAPQKNTADMQPALQKQEDLSQEKMMPKVNRPEKVKESVQENAKKPMKNQDGSVGASAGDTGHLAKNKLPHDIRTISHETPEPKGFGAHMPSFMVD